MREPAERPLKDVPLALIFFRYLRWAVFDFDGFDWVPMKETLARLRDRPYSEVKNQIAFLIWRPTAEDIQIR